jgi:WD40 repeat protein
VIGKINGTSKYVSSGIVSHGDECGKPGYPGIYTRTSSFLQWIDVNSYGTSKKSLLKFIFNKTNGGHNSDVRSLTLLSDGSIVSATTEEIKIWDLYKGKLRWTFDSLFTKNPKVIGKIGRFNDFASINLNKNIDIWEMNEPWNETRGRLKYSFNQSNGGHTWEIYSLANVWPYVASGSYDIKIWDIERGNLKFTFSATNGGHLGSVNAMVEIWMKDETFLASGGADCKVKIWDLSLGILKFTFDSSNGGHTKPVNELAFLQNGYLASAATDIKIWDVQHGKLKFTFDQLNGGHFDSIYCLSSLENGLLASGSRDYTIKIWDIVNGKLKITFDQTNGGHTSYVTNLLHIDNGFLVSGSLG